MQQARIRDIGSSRRRRLEAGDACPGCKQGYRLRRKRGQSNIGGIANGQERRKGRRAEENRSRKSGAAHRRTGTGSRESPERVPRRAAVEGRGGNTQERPQFVHTPPTLGEGRIARVAPG